MELVDVELVELVLVVVLMSQQSPRTVVVELALVVVELVLVVVVVLVVVEQESVIVVQEALDADHCFTHSSLGHWFSKVPPARASVVVELVLVVVPDVWSKRMIWQ